MVINEKNLQLKTPELQWTNKNNSGLNFHLKNNALIFTCLYSVAKSQAKLKLVNAKHCLQAKKLNTNKNLYKYSLCNNTPWEDSMHWQQEQPALRGKINIFSFTCHLVESNFQIAQQKLSFKRTSFLGQLSLLNQTSHLSILSHSWQRWWFVFEWRVKIIVAR